MLQSCHIPPNWNAQQKKQAADPKSSSVNVRWSGFFSPFKGMKHEKLKW